MVFASIPVVSVSRFAARPVGAHSKHRTSLARRIIRMEFTSVVLPTPGPPVITTIRFASTVFSASRWLGASVLPVLRSHHATAFSKSIGGWIVSASVQLLILDVFHYFAFLWCGMIGRAL